MKDFGAGLQGRRAVRSFCLLPTLPGLPPRGLACAGYLNPISRLNTGIVPGSVAKAMAAGAILGGSAPVPDRLASLLDSTGGKTLFVGTSSATRWRSAEPYRFREFDYEFNGVGEDEGQSFRIWVKNEHHLVWRGDRLVASSPDPIVVLDGTSLEPLTTLGDVQPGKQVVAVVVPALDAIWRTPQGLKLLGPQRFGFDQAPVILG